MDWTYRAEKSYTFSLGSLWVPVSSMWYNDATGYGQLLLDQSAVKQQLAPCLSLDLPFAPHLSFRQTFIWLSVLRAGALHGGCIYAVSCHYLRFAEP